MSHEIEANYYPIIYVRGYARSHAEREEVFNDTYYGFAATSVEKRQGPPDKVNNTYLQADVFEGQLVRFMKLRGYAYADAMNQGLEDFHDNPSRSMWISRFYDQDYINGSMRNIESHAKELRDMIVNIIPNRLIRMGMSPEMLKEKYKVILIAHSMGGLVCRTVIQTLLDGKKQEGDTNCLPEEKLTAKNLVHRLVTMGSPHRGINLGTIPDWVEDEITSLLSPDSKIFRPEGMRKYLKLGKDFDLHSLGTTDFPVKRCFCLIGSDHKSYTAAKYLTGSFSDGLVRQDNAYIVTGKPDAEGRYTNDQICYYANVHRAHSGYRGIVNSYESFENIQRFLFGNMKADMFVDKLVVNTVPPSGDVETFYDIDFHFFIRGTSGFLHRREQDPCENAIRIYRKNMSTTPNIFLHTAFLNSKLKKSEASKSHFSLAFKIVEYHIKKGFLWDREYPGRTIYSETAEIRLKDVTGDDEADEIEYRWLSDVSEWESDTDWQPVLFDNGDLRIPFRDAKTVSGSILIKPSTWNVDEVV